MADFSRALEDLIARRDLPRDAALGLMAEILSGNVPDARIAAALALLRAKGETPVEIAAFAQALRNSMLPVECGAAVVADTCGTGGDGKRTFNISTAAAFAAAGAGVTVAKHGNRSVTSACGSADVLEAAGVRIDPPKESAERCLKEIGIAFLYAPLYHPAMKHAAAARKALGLRTVFNLLGPLANPARANAQVIGVPKKELLPVMAKALLDLSRGRKGAFILVHESGYDEVVLRGTARMTCVWNGKVRSFGLTPKDFGLGKTRPEDLAGGNAMENARTLREVLSGGRHPLRDVAAANAALALWAADLAAGRAKTPDLKSLRAAAVRAARSLDEGRALKKLDDLIAWSGKRDHP
ncbi:MAG: anthranilate phosphoribosyltransferase [Elusimicrobia bacterium RIFCSPLOWO2_01_FULL_64_13]|nr:MAG: anthranilate phosphoribosyltransferase [Elusimicrobia bacterium RIFCSPLOWO2_01_FULL_64_13]